MITCQSRISVLKEKNKVEKQVEYESLREEIISSTLNEQI